MKCTVVISESREEEVIIYARNRRRIVGAIEKLAAEEELDLIGYNDKLALRLRVEDINCFTVEKNKVFAVCDKGRYQVKQRLYVLEEMFAEGFVRINQSCIANIDKIEKFDASFAGALTVVFKCGYKDYVSRRQTKNVKERLGL